jgi:O-antigen/teichoic acid export membrane protein
MSQRKDVIANYLGQAWISVIGIAFVPIYIRYLGMESYGLIGIFSIVFALCTILDGGMTPTLNREMARFHAGGHSTDSIADLTRSIELVCIGVAGAIIFIGWITADWLAMYWIGPSSIPYSTVSCALFLMTVVTGLRILEGVYRGALLGLHRHVWLNSVASALATLRVLGAIATLAWISPTIVAFFAWQALISLFTVLILGLSVWQQLHQRTRIPQFSMPALIEIRRFAGGMTVVTILAIVLTQLDKVLLSRLLSLEAFAHYALAALLAGSLPILTAPITSVYFPRMAGLILSNASSELNEEYHRSAQLVSIFTGSAAIFIATFAHPILLTWTNDSLLADQVSPLLTLLTIGTLFNCLMWIPYHLQLAHGWLSLSIKLNTVAVIILVPAILYIAPRYGGEGTAWIWLGLNATYLTIGVYLMHRRLLTTAKWRWYVDDLSKPLAGALATSMLFYWLFPDELSRGARVSLLLIGLGLTVAGAVVATKPIRQLVLRYFMGSLGIKAELPTDGSEKT